MKRLGLGVALCVALGCVEEIKNLFTQVEYGSIEEVLRERTQG